MNNVFNKRNVLLLIVFIIVVSFYSISSTYAKFEQGYTTKDNVVDYNFDLNFDIKSYSDSSGSVNTIEEYEVVSIRANSYVLFNVDVSNTSSSLIYYGIWYKNLSDIYTDIDVSKYIASSNDTFSSLESGGTKTSTIVVINNENVNVKIKIGVASSYNGYDDILYDDGRMLISNDVISNVNNNMVNEPVLSGNMIPVSYDDKNHYWVKADYNNKSGSWYDYYDKRWANVILVRDDVIDDYINKDIGSVINLNDVLAFYVWIPRFKYLVWDINRQTSNISNYSYDVINNGVGIIFESDGNSTGNVSCNYNYTSLSGLFDECNYSSNEVTMNSMNSVYADAWYTHPAFTLDGSNLNGFWVGKFETTGTIDNPSIIPDSKAITNYTLSDFYHASLKFNDYGIGDFKSRLIRNVEWGALVYLTHSIYGLCNNDFCSDININNSIQYYTGRSSGVSLVDEANLYGTYSYDGYGIIDGVRDNNYNYGVISSTTGNVSGVYDVAGGALEYVMGGIKNDVLIGDDINSSYYDLYSSFSTINDSYYRARLGDATAEVSIGGNTWNNILKSNIEDDGIWIIRGTGSNMYGYEYVSGGANSNYGFRSVIS